MITMICHANGVNFRSEPSLNSTSIGSISQGNLMKVNFG